MIAFTCSPLRHAHRQSQQQAKSQAGFSLLEVLIALIVFTVGFMGVSQYTGNALKRSADDNSRAVSLSAISQLLSPMYVAASTSPTAFKNALDQFTAADGLPVSVGNDNYTVRISEAKDDAGTSIINASNPDTWVSPVRIGVTVTYQGLNGNIVSKAPYTFILTP